MVINTRGMSSDPAHPSKSDGGKKNLSPDSLSPVMPGFTPEQVASLQAIISTSMTTAITTALNQAQAQAPAPVDPQVQMPSSSIGQSAQSATTGPPSATPPLPSFISNLSLGLFYGLVFHLAYSLSSVLRPRC